MLESIKEKDDLPNDLLDALNPLAKLDIRKQELTDVANSVPTANDARWLEEA